MWFEKRVYFAKHTSEAFKEDTRFYYHQLKEIDSLQQLPEDDYVKIAFNINRETHPNVDEEVATQFSNDIKLCLKSIVLILLCQT